MDFLDPHKKRKQRTQLYVGYGLTAIALAIATFILVFVAYGYGIDRHTGGIIQNGLIIVDAHPDTANVIVNQVNRGTTINRLVLPAGNYDVRLQRTGYRDWKHQVSLEGSSIEQLAYPFLFPTSLVTKTIQEFPNVPAFVSQSPDRHWLMVQPQSTTLAFTVFDLNNNKNPSTIINVPPDLITTLPGAPTTYEPIEWANDNVHLLLKHSFGSSREFLIVDRGNPSASVNLNKLFPDQQFNSVSLRDKKTDQLYLFNSVNGNLMAADLHTKVATLAAAHVISYKSYQADVLSYITNPNVSTATVELHLSQNKDDHLVRTLPVSATYLLDMAQFNGHFYLASGSQADGHIYVYKDPLSDLNRSPARMSQPFRVLIISGAEYVSFSGISRFVMVQNGSNFALYDIETSRQFRYDMNLPDVAHQKASWMDGHRLSLVSQGKINIFDFDGLNVQSLSPSLDGLSPFFDRDYTAMFTFAPVPNVADKSTLTRTDLKVLLAGTTNQ